MNCSRFIERTETGFAQNKASASQRKAAAATIHIVSFRMRPTDQGRVVGCGSHRLANSESWLPAAGAGSGDGPQCVDKPGAEARIGALGPEVLGGTCENPADVGGLERRIALDQQGRNAAHFRGRDRRSGGELMGA